MSQYLILIYDSETAWDSASPEEIERVHTGHGVFGEKNAAALVGGNALQFTTTATTVRPDGAGGHTVTDGPFLETKEALGGYYLVEAPDLDVAIEIAKGIPLFTSSGGLEVRPIQVFN